MTHGLFYWSPFLLFPYTACDDQLIKSHLCAGQMFSLTEMASLESVGEITTWMIRETH